MKKFKCIETGAILLVDNKFTIKQLIKNDKYEEIKEKVDTSLQKKTVENMNKKELVAYLKDLDIEASEDMKKGDLLALIPEEKEENEEV